MTLCWDCRNSTEKECEWSRDFQPVEGWEATKRITKSGETTYLVKECPKFIRDSWHYGDYRYQEDYQEYLDKKEARQKKQEERERRRNEQANNHRKPDERP